MCCMVLFWGGGRGGGGGSRLVCILLCPGSQAGKAGWETRQAGKQRELGTVLCSPALTCLVHQGCCHGGVDAARQRADDVVGGAHLQAGTQTGGQAWHALGWVGGVGEGWP